MVLVFIFLSILILLLFIFTIFLFCTLQIKIKNLKIGQKESSSKIKGKYEVKITLYFLNKVPIIWIKLNNEKMKKIYSSKKIEKIDLKKIEKKVPINKQLLEAIKNLKIKLKNLNLRIDIGTEDAILTSYFVAIVASIIGIILPHITEKEKIKNCHYIVNPLYKDKNEYNIQFDGIIYIKIVHIISSILLFIKKGRDKNERTSNRRAYAYRYE